MCRVVTYKTVYVCIVYSLSIVFSDEKKIISVRKSSEKTVKKPAIIVYD